MPSFLLFKHNKQLRVGDKIIFQWGDPMALPGVDIDYHEEEVAITHVHDGPGIYAGYQLVGWEEKV